MRLSSVEKALLVIEHLKDNPRGLSLAELSLGLGYNKSTVHHLLSTMLPHDYVAQDPETRRYSLGFRFLTIGRAIIDNLDVRTVAGRHLRALHEACGEAVHLAILRNGKVVYIDKIDKPGGLSLATYVGFATDPHAAAGGKVLLSELTKAEVDEILGGKPLRPYGKRTIIDPEKLQEELELVRARGWALDDEEYYEGARCVAAPVRAGGRIVAAVSITGSVFSLTMERIEAELVGPLLEATGRISAEMRW